MSSEVIVAFGDNKEYEFRILESDLATCNKDQAMNWFDDEWEALECVPTHPMGKVLLLDKILGVARYGGEKRFADGVEWARVFCRNAAFLLGRPAVRVDVAENRIG